MELVRDKVRNEETLKKLQIRLKHDKLAQKFQPFPKVSDLSLTLRVEIFFQHEQLQ